MQVQRKRYKPRLRLKYSVIAEVRRSRDHGEYLTYGIQVSERTRTCWRGRGVIHDITTVRQTADEMVRTFNLWRLSPEYFKEAVEDWLVNRV
jgi:hypothetical protein